MSFRRVLPSLLLLAAVVAPAAPSAGETSRPYEAGPLQSEDFRKQPPADARHHAHTVTRLGYAFRYRSLSRDGRSTVTLSSLELTNRLIQSESWNRRRNDTKLLAHEQGHFDLTEVIRRRARAYLRRKMPEMRFRHASLPRAVEALEEAMRKEMAPFFARMALLQKQYDQETRHGLDDAEQARWRRQIELLLENPSASIPSAPP